MNEFERWANFYLLTSASAGALIGLLFVVISLAAERKYSDATRIPIYLTPTIIYFASVLFLAALLTIPTHTRLSATLCICLTGLAGLVYSGSFFIRRSVKKLYYNLNDLIVYAAIPFVAYGLGVWGGILFLYFPQRGLTLVAADMLLLLAVAIRNSWAIATDVATSPPGQRDSR